MATNGFDKRPQDINKGGRPKGSGLSLTTILKKKLESISKEDKAEYSKLFIDRLVDKALKDDDTQAMKLIFGYVDGLPKQAVDLTSQGEKIIPIYAGQSISRHTSEKKNIQSEQKD